VGEEVGKVPNLEAFEGNVKNTSDVKNVRKCYKINYNIGGCLSKVPGKQSNSRHLCGETECEVLVL
jgi:hypothetical protein